MRRSCRVSVHFFCLIVIWLLMGGTLSAQVDMGTILGVVKDQSGGVIAGAQVRITHEATGRTLVAFAHEDGRFIFTPIPIGSYTVEVEFSGFQKVRRSGIGLSIQQQAVVDFTLVPGAPTDTINVTAALPTLQTEDGSVGQVVKGDTVNNLPLNGRDWSYLARLSAGVTPPQPGARADGQFSANGTRPAQNNYLLDGIDNNSNNIDFLTGRAYVVPTPVDAVAEFKIQTSAFKAETGRAGGAVLNATLKSGSNELHGSAWEFIRNDILDANNFFSNAAGRNPDGTPVIGKPPLRRNQFGATAGGPIKKNKLFWFVDYEGTRASQGVLWNGMSVPTAAERSSGYTDFSDLLQPDWGGPTDLLGRSFVWGQILDPATTRPVTAGAVDTITGLTATDNGYVRDPFPNNVIPAHRLNPNAIKLMNLYPSPNVAGVWSNYNVGRTNSEDTNSFDVRMDYNISDKDRIFGRYSYSKSTRLRPAPFDGVADGGGYSEGDETVNTHGAAVSYTHIFSQSLINEARLGISREHSSRASSNSEIMGIPEQYGIQGVPQTPHNGGLPDIYTPWSLSWIGAFGWLPADRFSNTTQLSENLTKIYKSHIFKGGVEYQDIRFPWLNPPCSQGYFYYNGSYTTVPTYTDGLANRAQMLLTPIPSLVPGGIDNVGGPDQLGLSSLGYVNSMRNYFGAYFQDDWKVNRKLTLNLGLRWEYFGLVGVTDDAQANFVPGSNAQFIMPKSKKDNPPLSQSFLDTLKLDGIQLNYTDQYGSGLGIIQKKNFGPRIGVAYQFTNKLVLRGGYGIQYASFENRGAWPSLGYNYPFQYEFDYYPVDGAHPIMLPNGAPATLETGLAGISLDPAQASGAGLTLRAVEFHYQTPYTQSFNVTLQYALTAHDSIEMAYVGSLGRHLEMFVNPNDVTELLPPGTDTTSYRPYPDFGWGSVLTRTAGVSDYHSMQATWTRRMSKGLDLIASYTWGKTLTNAGDLLSPGGTGSLRASNVKGFGLENDIGLAGFDLKHNLTVGGTYELPFGKGRALFSNLSGIKEAFFGGWSTNFILNLHSGFPQTIGCTRPTAEGLKCNAIFTGQDPRGGDRSINSYYNPDAFTNPPEATEIGQANFAPLGGAPTQVTGPPLHNLDFSLFKQFRTSEHTYLQFRAEAFNLTNTPSFGDPGNLNFENRDTFGMITSTRNSARQIQFGLKFYF